MTPSPDPKSYSIFRGQSRTGIGEGPGSAVSHGEQYLHAEADLAADASFLRTIRPWLTLDFDPADLRKLGDRLEAWSSFEADGRFFVARLVPAGVYDRRAAYFAHGRSWTLSSSTDGFDPGVLLGYSAAFEEPWRDELPGSRHVVPEVPEDAFRVRVKQDVRLQGDKTRIAAFVAHLFQAMVEQRPLVVAAPLGEFVTGGSLATSLCHARAALPADLKRRCRIRVYTSQPERFIRHHGVDLVALPEKLASDAMRADPEAILLDHQGQCRSRFQLDKKVTKYAEVVTERMMQTPDGLLAFSARYAARHRRNGAGLPSPCDRGTLVLIYNLAFGLTGSQQRREALLREYLVKTARKVNMPWHELIDSGEWAFFPDAALADLLLESDPGESARSLQASAQQAIRAFPEDRQIRVRSLLEERLHGENGTDPHRQRRLLELFSQELISYEAAKTNLSSIPLAKIEDFGLLPSVLRAEMEAGVLNQRSGDPSLAEIARRNQDVVKVLADATSRGKIEVTWAETLLEDPARSAPALFNLAYHLLGSLESWNRWNGVTTRLVDTLRTSPIKAALWPTFFDQVERSLDRLRDRPLTLVQLAELQVIHQPGNYSQAERLQSYRDLALADLDDPQGQEQVIDLTLQDDWRSLQPQNLFNANGELRWSWLHRYTKQLLASSQVLDQLSTRQIVQLLESSSGLQKLFEELDLRMYREPGQTTQALVQSGWWPSWRRRRGAHYEHRSTALAWLTCPVWQMERRSSRLPTRETWAQVLQDLGTDGLSCEDARSLFRDQSPTWPLIPPFELDQLAELGETARDLDTLAELAERVDECCAEIVRDESVEILLQKSRFKGQIVADDLLWLIEERYRQGRKLRPLSLEASLALYRGTHSEKRRQAAHRARVQAILQSLDDHPLEALRAAGVADPNLWTMKDRGFLDGLVTWMSRSKSIHQLGGKGVVQAIEEQLQPGSVHSSRVSCESLLRDLQRNGCKKNVIRFLTPAAPESLDSRLTDKVFRALCHEDPKDPCWGEILTLIHNRKSERPHDHPFFGIAADLRRRHFEPEDLQKLAVSSWKTFSQVASANATFCFFATPSDRVPLPAFDLITSVTPRGTLGNLALGIVFAEGSRIFQEDARWWRSLFLGIRESRRTQEIRGTQDRSDVAISILLARSGDLGPKASHAMNQALSEIGPPWLLNH